MFKKEEIKKHEKNTTQKMKKVSEKGWGKFEEKKKEKN
jgi:hypothetical protein